MKYAELSAKKLDALHARFGATVNVGRELANARQYAEEIHTGRPYRNYGKFLWNWMRRCEEKALERGISRRPAGAAPAVDARPRTSIAELEAMLAEETLPNLREAMERELEILRSEARSGAGSTEVCE